ncbi:MAG: hypothetical protein M3Z00_05675 [Actinomycetota bacterium]|nr:hypothetical protein [Actinomycetota bacterium]
MSRWEDGLELSASRPPPHTLVPIERDVLTGKAIPLDHRDKQRHRDRTNRDPHPQQLAAPHAAAIPRPRISAVAAAGTATAVFVVAGGIFLLSRPGSRPSSAVALAPTGSPTSIAATMVSASGATSGSLGSTAGTTVLTTAAANPIAASAAPVVESATSSIVSTTGTRPSTGSRISASKTPTSSSASAIAPAGFNGTYHAVYKYVSGTGTGALIIGKSTTATLRVRTTCSSRSVCSTVININGTAQPAIPAGRGTWSASTTGEVACRDFYTNKLIGGSYRFHDTTSYRATAGSGSLITKLTGTDRLNQLTKCPNQAQVLMSIVAPFTLTRTGP